MRNPVRNPVIAALLATAFFSVEAQAADLLQIYKDALANDAQYASARASQVAGTEKAVQGRAGLLPSVARSGSDTKAHNDIAADNQRYSGNGDNYTNVWQLLPLMPDVHSRSKT